MGIANMIGGIALGAVVAFFAGYFVRSSIGRDRLTSAERKARDVLEQAAREAESVRRGAAGSIRGANVSTRSGSDATCSKVWRAIAASVSPSN